MEGTVVEEGNSADRIHPQICGHRYRLGTCSTNRLNLPWMRRQIFIIMKTSRRSHIAPILSEVHWLPVAHRIIYKVMCLVYKALNEASAPVYLRPVRTVWTSQWSDTSL